MKLNKKHIDSTHPDQSYGAGFMAEYSTCIKQGEQVATDTNYSCHFSTGHFGLMDTLLNQQGTPIVSC